MVQVQVSVESARGCGYRKPASDGVGIYLVGPSGGAPCFRLPLELHVCAACGAGVKPARSWQWIDPSKLFGVPQRACEPESGPCVQCVQCPFGLGMPEGRHGLLWIGEKFYPTPNEYMREASRMGVSRKIRAIPNGFELGKTWVYLAHRVTVRRPLQIDPETNEPATMKAVFTAFKPTGIDLVIEDENRVPVKAEHLAEKFGARVLVVERACKQVELTGISDEGEES